MASNQFQSREGSKKLPIVDQAVGANLACGGSIISNRIDSRINEQVGSNSSTISSSQKQIGFAGPKIPNEAHLIENRRIFSDPKSQKSLELMCEDKSSRYKLEEAHSSLPSALKPTFIMTFSPDGQRVASTHGDHRIYICDLSTGRLLDTLEGHPKTPWCLAWHPSNREILASGCLAGEVRVWDLRTKACESWTSENNSIITSLDFHPKERILVIATANDIHFWDWSDSKPFAKTTTCHDKKKVRFVVFDSSGTKLITGISNLPNFSGYNSDSLQNRIIDSYLTQGTIDPLPTENMTQSSETATPLNGHLDANENFNDRNATHPSALSRSSSSVNNELDFITYRSTVLLSRIATLYQQLESLEDSMRHTSFSPYVNPRQISSTNEANDNDSETSAQSDQDGNQERTISGASELFNEASNSQQSSNEKSTQSSETPTTRANIDQRARSLSSESRSNPRSTITPNSFEPFVVSFDEYLEQLQLGPLVIDGQTINLATIVEQYPLNLSYQLQYLTQVESINQVNQNFIRISKLMSSVRLYRQVVQQISSSCSGQAHYQPNQILTAQCESPRSSRQVSNLPIVLRSFPSIGNPLSIANAIETVTPNRNSRSTDPILAIQFRNSARNVPLVSTCKIGLLSARSICIMRSQQLIENAVSGSRNSNGDQQHQGARTANTGEQYSNAGDQGTGLQSQPFSQTSFFPLLSQLHQSLTVINHAPLTTSNVHNHILTLRGQINRLLKEISSILHSQDEAQRMVALIHDIAHSLTGRSWSIPLGATLDDIRLDVIHTLCIVDLTLHLTRQVQLLQMQRLSAIARIELSRRVTTNLVLNNDEGGSSRNETYPSTSTINATGEQPTFNSSPGTSNNQVPSAPKRKDPEVLSTDAESRKKRMRTSPSLRSSTHSSTSDVGMIDSMLTSPNQDRDSETIRANNNQSPSLNFGQFTSPSNATSATPMTTAATDPLSNERVLVLDSPPPYESNSQRYMLAAASSVIDNHFLVRIYHRLQGNSAALDPAVSTERFSMPPHESRRRALSQDDIVSPGSNDGTIGNELGGRVARGQTNNYNPPASSGNPANLTVNAWQRVPILQVYHTSRGPGSHIWFNHLTFPFLPNSYNYRLQCWDFSLSALPNIKDCQSNVVTDKCRIHNDSSIDISGDGSLIACLVPRDVGSPVPSLDMKIFSLRSFDFGVCYYQLPHGPNAISVSFSPSSKFFIVGLSCNKYVSIYDRDDDLTIAKVFKLNGNHTHEFIRDIKIKRDSSLNLNAIRWMSRGIVYNVGPQHHHRYLPMRSRAS